MNLKKDIKIRAAEAWIKPVTLSVKIQRAEATWLQTISEKEGVSQAKLVQEGIRMLGEKYSVERPDIAEDEGFKAEFKERLESYLDEHRSGLDELDYAFTIMDAGRLIYTEGGEFENRLRRLIEEIWPDLPMASMRKLKDELLRAESSMKELLNGMLAEELSGALKTLEKIKL